MQMLDMREVREIVPVSRPTIYALMAKGKFPKAMRIGGKLFWPRDEIDAWLEARKAERT